MREIPLDKGQTALVDDEDFENLSRFNWVTIWARKTQSYYATCRVRVNGRRRRLYMHRVLFGLEWGDKTVIDHVDHNTLNNQKSNLKLTTYRGNAYNRRDQSACGAGIAYRKDRRKSPYIVKLLIAGKQCYLGSFSTLEEATKCRDAKLGELSCTNK